MEQWEYLQINYVGNILLINPPTTSVQTNLQNHYPDAQFGLRNGIFLEIKFKKSGAWDMDCLNYLGSLGWELVGLTGQPFVYMLKRKIKQ